MVINVDNSFLFNIIELALIIHEKITTDTAHFCCLLNFDKKKIQNAFTCLECSRTTDFFVNIQYNVYGLFYFFLS